MDEVVIATVKGDIHDIGKNIVKVIMENYGLQDDRSGKRCPCRKPLLETVKEKNIKLVGLSALMTTTLKSMEETIVAVKEAAPDCRVMARRCCTDGGLCRNRSERIITARMR